MKFDRYSITSTKTALVNHPKDLSFCGVLKSSNDTCKCSAWATSRWRNDDFNGLKLSSGSGQWPARPVCWSQRLVWGSSDVADTCVSPQLLDRVCFMQRDGLTLYNHVLSLMLFPYPSSWGHCGQGIHDHLRYTDLWGFKVMQRWACQCPPEEPLSGVGSNRSNKCTSADEKLLQSLIPFV